MNDCKAMNANWLPLMPVTKDHRHGGAPLLRDWIAKSSSKLVSIGINTAKLDVEIILVNCLRKNRTYLHANPELEIDNITLQEANRMVKQRIKRIPIAYIIGYKEFYGRNFNVNKNTLIPRPESETIIDLLKNIYSEKTIKLIDVGTGSGCLGITAKIECPALDVTLIDISQQALQTAALNAKALATQITTLQSDLLENYTENADIIIANLPYVDKLWERSPETNHEPSLALFADDNGKDLIKKLIVQSTDKLSNGGYLIIEADPIQHDCLINFAACKSFTLFTQQDYIMSFIYSS